MAFLEACSKKDNGTGGAAAAPTSTFSVASPQAPVKWPIYDDNKPIASGLTPVSYTHLTLPTILRV